MNPPTKHETTLELAPRERQAVSTIEPRDPESILRYALEKNAPVDVIERLLAVRNQLQAEAAKAAFDSAMAAFQAECPPIDKPKGVPDRTGKVSYSYAPLEYIIARVKDLLLKHGFSYSLDTDVESKDGWVVAKCNITHRMGHSRTSSAKFPMGTKTQIMSDTQVYAAALTFASRRVFCNAFGLVPTGEDMDGRTSKPKPEGPSTLAAEPSVKDLARELWNLLASVRGTEKNWNKANAWLWAEDILDGAVPEAAPDLTAKRFREVIEKARSKIV